MLPLNIKIDISLQYRDQVCFNIKRGLKSTYFIMFHKYANSPNVFWRSHRYHFANFYCAKAHKNLRLARLSCSAALNGSSDFAVRTLSFRKISSPSAASRSNAYWRSHRYHFANFYCAKAHKNLRLAQAEQRYER